MIETDRPSVVVYRRSEHGFAATLYEGLDAAVPLPEVGVELPLTELYERVDFGAEEA